MYPLGDPGDQLESFDFGSVSQTVEQAGLAISPDGTRLFVVTGDNGSQSPTDTFRVMSLPPHDSNPTTTSTIPGNTATTTTTPPGNNAQGTLGTTRVTPSTIAFGPQRVGTYGAGKTITVKNNGPAAVSLKNIAFGGAAPDFFGVTNCFPKGRPRVLAAGASCKAVVYFAPAKLATRNATVIVTDNTATSPHKVSLAGSGSEGYFIGGAHGQVANFGDAVYHGDATRVGLQAPIVSLRTTPNGAGYWLLGRDGGIFSYGNAHFYGSTGNLALRQPVLGMTPAHDGAGYWLVASDGGIFAFGDAHFYGSTGNLALRKPIVGMAATPTGHGYWLVASDGGIFAFGDAHFYGSTGNLALQKPIVGMAATPTRHGYWLVASDGGIFAFGDARFYGAPSNANGNVVGIATTPSGHGYWTLTNTGRVSNFGDAPFYGDVGNVGTTEAIGIAPTAPPLAPARVTFSKASALAAAERELGAPSTAIRGVEP